MVRDEERARTCATQLEAVQSGFGAATGEGIEAELPEGEGLAGTTRDRVSKQGVRDGAGMGHGPTVVLQ